MNIILKLCNVIFFMNKKNKMNNQIEHIPSGGIGEMYLDGVDKHWYRCESTEYAKEKIIPLFKFLYDSIGVRARYRTNHTRLRRNEEIPQRIVKVIRTASKLIEGFNRIQGLADDLFCTGVIQTIDCPRSLQTICKK